MILLTEKAEASSLILHMSVMRADFRNLLKRKYKMQKGEYLKAYDYIKKECETQIVEDLEYKEQHLNIVDLRVLHEFLNAYLKKLRDTLKEVKQDEDEQIFYLESVKKRCEELLADVS